MVCGPRRAVPHPWRTSSSGSGFGLALLKAKTLQSVRADMYMMMAHVVASIKRPELVMEPFLSPLPGMPDHQADPGKDGQQ